MRGLFDINIGSKILQSIFSPFEYIMSKRLIGRLLQIFHIINYFILIGVGIIFPETRKYIAGFFIGLVIIFFLFGGCILTKTEMYFLQEKVTTPGIIFDFFGIRSADKETDKFMQGLFSLVSMLLPIILFLFILPSPSSQNVFLH
jgi:hypothetical protein